MSQTTRTSPIPSVGPSLSRLAVQYPVDVVAWGIALSLASILRYDNDFGRIHWWSVLGFWVFVSVVQLGAGWSTHIYRKRYSTGSLDEVKSVAISTVSTAVIAWLPLLITGTTLLVVPRSIVPIAAPVAFLLMCLARYAQRLMHERTGAKKQERERTLILGAGFLANHLLPRMKHDPDSRYIAVGMIDDDPSKRNVRLHGVQVLGNREELARIVAETRSTTLIVAVARADARLIRDVSDAADALDLRVMVLPTFETIVGGASGLSDLRDVSIEDLIGRHPVDTQIDSIAGYLVGKRVLVTGAGGSIGSELCRQISRFGPSELIMLDRDETGLQSAQISIQGHGLLDTRDVVLADIRDAETLNTIFESRKPEVVFHAAALKHLPMLEQYPDEAWKTNVLGTLNVLNAARAVGVNTFVNISTDKAANPTSVLGHSKRVAEKLTAWAAEDTGRTYLSVRFGNVIGSRGSMLPTFTSLIEAGGPLTVTHPDVTRFFMTIAEACQLVVQAGGIGRPAEVLILDMGEPVRILDIAERMIARSGKDVGIVFTGLRPGEKLHEELIGEGEQDARPFHPKISHASVDTLAPKGLDHDRWLERCGFTPEDIAHFTGGAH
ncbi:polysaccharide biosynthesis protein [Lysinibacter cavernae]|uniref:dTDP-glucose 4,6-dehydratase n=1 Tax=Lysinibacter cavernae TaxID=1640652 RepID=A0A7X5R2A8_9MICO|nr:nucleoside-diphosphate sugar epimerase/dehydratase [Lysinibacter cavernae]NIH54122.1 dTDP-glucose 4,6-dehydratase [Lysinibacter cavernae]